MPLPNFIDGVFTFDVIRIAGPENRPAASFYYRCPPCGPGTVCTSELSSSEWARYGCCAPGEVLCKGVCRSGSCPGNQLVEGASCSCACSFPWNDDTGGINMMGRPHCNVGRTWDPIGCRCVCDTTLPCSDSRMTRNPITCACDCPRPLSDCYGFCVDLLNDPIFCGSCATTCGTNENCCGGTCRDICTPNDCGSCNRPIRAWAGEKCCGCRPVQLGTDLNCSDCGDLCTNGRTCINRSCQCPSGSRACSSTGPCCPTGRECCSNGTICCPTGTKCCNGACVDVSTNPLHCGRCNTPCAIGASCVRGTCVCPPNQIVCGVSPGVCLDNMVLPDGPGWITWRAMNPGAPIFTCPNGTFTCNAAAGVLTVAGGCCPPGNPTVVQGVCCPAGSTTIVNGACQ